jgi:hypothetical protein
MNKPKKGALPKGLWALLFVVLVSCAKTVEPRSELASFAQGFSLQSCLDTYKKGSFSYTMSLSKNGVKEGEHTDSIAFARTQSGSFSYQREKTTSGSLVNSANPASVKTTYQAQSDGSYLCSSEKDGTVTNSNVDEAAVGKVIDSFFYAKQEGGKYTGGFYYGDDVTLRWSFQEYMRIDSEKNLLIYEVKDYVNNNATTSLYYEVNSLGMCLNWRQNVIQGDETLNASYAVVI